MSSFNSDTDSDTRFMLSALECARKGYGFVDPNPLVGAVIVDGDMIVAQGYHETYGQFHAERNALADAASKGIDVRGLTMYVTLEPCSHYGKTPPCAIAVVEAGIARVVVGSLDPNPKVDGKGISILRDAGITVDILTGPAHEACMELNESFFHFIETGEPFVILKYAMSLDGKIAGAEGDQLTISNVQSHARVHQERARYAAIVTGVGTVVADDPQLTARPAHAAGEQGIHQPLRVIVDSNLRTPLTSAVVRESGDDGLTVIATTSTDDTRIQLYEKAGCTVMRLPAESDAVAAEYQRNQTGQTTAKGRHRVSISALVAELGKRRVDSVLLETGGTLAASFLAAHKVQRVEAFVAPIIVGAASAPSPVNLEPSGNQTQLSASIALHDVRFTHYDEDIAIEGRVTYGEHAENKKFSKEK